MSVCLIPVLLVDRYWPQIKSGIEEVCRRSGGQYTPEYLHGIIRRGEAYFVADIDDGSDTVRAAVICQHQQWGPHSVLFLHACWGKPYDSRAFTAWAKENLTFDRIAFNGRRGWARLPGVKIEQYVYSMEV